MNDDELAAETHPKFQVEVRADIAKDLCKVERA